MPRTTSEAVALIVEVDSTISLTPFIEIANSLVTEICEPLGHTSERLEQIERYLSAHFYKLRDQAVASEKAGSVAESFQYEIGLALMQTKEGQMACLLDTKGGLAALSKKTEKGESRPSFFWGGTERTTTA